MNTNAKVPSKLFRSKIFLPEKQIIRFWDVSQKKFKSLVWVWDNLKAIFAKCKTIVILTASWTNLEKFGS